MDKKVKVKNIIDFRTMKYFYMYNLKSKNFLVIYSIFAALCLVLAGVALGVPLIKKETVDWFLPAALAAFSVYLLYTVMTIEKKIDTNITNHFISRRPSEQILTIDEEGVTVSYGSDIENPVTFEWLMITKIHEIPQFYYMFSGKQLILIDKDPNAFIEGDIETLEEIMKAQIAVKPYKKITKELVKKPITFIHQYVEEAEEVKTTIEEDNPALIEEDNPTLVEDANPVEPTDQDKND